MVYHEKEDREEERCEGQEGYSFTACVKVGQSEAHYHHHYDCNLWL